jgi:hypothetical protein
MRPHAKITLPDRFVLDAEFYENLPFVWGILNGERRRFIFDSGGQDLTLNSRYVAPESSTPGTGVQGASGKADSCHSQGNHVSFGDWRIEDFELIAIDMQHLEEEMGVEIHGVLGFRHLIHYDWMVDYKGGRISFWSRMNRAELNILERVFVQYRHHLPMVGIQVGDQTYQFLVDTGAFMVLFDQRHEAAVAPIVQDLVEDTMASASAHRAQVRTGTLSAFQCGILQFEGPHCVKFMDLSHMKSMGAFDGIIGYPLLSKYRVVQSWSVHSFFFLAD